MAVFLTLLILFGLFGVWEGLRFVIVALPGLFSYLFYYLSPVCLGLFALSLGVIVRLCSVIVALPAQLYYFP